MVSEVVDLLLVSNQASRRSIEEATVIMPARMEAVEACRVALVEPVFSEFRQAHDNELGYAFLAISQLAPKTKERLTVFITYSQTNAMQYKGYLIDVKTAMSQHFPHVNVLHVPYVKCGVPMGGAVIAITGANLEGYEPKTTDEVVMPSDYFEGLLSHVSINRPNYPIMVSSRSIGAVRSDTNLLPSFNTWKGRSLMVEYREGNTTSIRRMKMGDVGKLMGTSPCNYTDDLVLCVPAGVIHAFA
jgi:hypothetical protein